MKSLRLPKKRYMYTTVSMWKRFLAFVLDILIIDILLFTPFSSFFAKMNADMWMNTNAVPSWFFLLLGCMGILALLYFSLLEYYLGATIGMQVMRIAVSGDRSLGRCMLRNLFIIPVFPFTLLWLVEPVHLFIKKYRLLEGLSRMYTVERVEV